MQNIVAEGGGGIVAGCLAQEQRRGECRQRKEHEYARPQHRHTITQETVEDDAGLAAAPPHELNLMGGDPGGDIVDGLRLRVFLVHRASSSRCEATPGALVDSRRALPALQGCPRQTTAPGT